MLAPDLFAYVVARDYGFAPNPFHGLCTLANCKPTIRRTAGVGDWIIGLGSAEEQRRDTLVFAMVVTERLSHQQYWEDPRFLCKRPNVSGSLTQCYGDNIYHHMCGAEDWVQEDSHHSGPRGCLNKANMTSDLSGRWVLVSFDFVYFGANAVSIPSSLSSGASWCDLTEIRRGHRRNFPLEQRQAIQEWIRVHLQPWGVRGDPHRWLHAIRARQLNLFS